MVLFILFAAPPGALAGEKIFLTGAEGGSGNTYYTFLGLVAPLLDNNLGDGLVHRYWVDFLGYSYESNQEIDAQALGVEGALGYQTSGQSAWGGVYAGVRYNNTWLSPDDLGNKIRGEHVWLKTQLEGGVDLAETWKLGGIASYIFEAESYWMRTRLLHRLDQGLSIGPEAVFMGDNSYRAWQLGWVVTGFEPAPKVTIGVKVGVKITEGADVDGLVGIEVVNLF